MRGEKMLYRDQWSNIWFASTVRELREKVGGGRVGRMFRDDTRGRALHVGYVVGKHWCSMYRPVEGVVVSGMAPTTED